MNSAELTTAELTTEVQPVFRAVAWRQAGLRGLTIAAHLLATTVATILAWLLVDAWWNLPAEIRVCGPWSVLIVAAIVIARDRWRRTAQNDATRARLIERAYPEFQERLSTDHDLQQQPVPTTRTGRWFRFQVRRETLARLQHVDPARVISDAEMQRAMGIATAVLVASLFPLFWWGDGYLHLTSRWLYPWANLGWGCIARIVVEPNDGAVVRDRDLAVSALLMRYRPTSDATPPLNLHWREQGETDWQNRPLSPDAEGTYSGIIPHVARNVEWLVRGKGVESPRRTTRVIDPPQVRSLTAVVDPPGYTGRGSQEITVVRDLAVLAGSRVTLNIMWDQPLREAELFWPPSKDDPAPVVHRIKLDAHRTGGVVEAVAFTSGPFFLRAVTRDGITIDDPPRTLTVRADQPPVVQLLGPATLAVRPDERHRIAARAADDFGLTTVDLHLEIAGRTQEPLPFPPSSSMIVMRELSQTVDLLPWKLVPGSAVTLRVRVRDNREQPGPQEGWSTPQVLVISPSALSADERRLADSSRQARDALGEIIRELETERVTLRDIHQKTAAATVREKPAGQETRLQELAAGHRDLQDKLNDWTALLPDDGPGEALREQIAQLTDGMLATAAQRIETAPKLPPRDQIPALSQALDDLAAARTALKKIDDALIARAALGDDLQTLRQLANRSERVAESLETGNTGGETGTAADEVQQIRAELAQVVRRRPEWQTAMDQAARVEQVRQAADQPASALTPANIPDANDRPSSPNPKSGPVPIEAGADLAVAGQQLQRAQEKLTSIDDSEPTVSEALQTAAMAFRAAIAKTAGPTTPSESRPPRDSDSDTEAQSAGAPGDVAGNGSGLAPEILSPNTAASGKSNRNWGRLPTGLKTEILQGNRRPAHPDYAQQVQRYFERIAQPTPTSPMEPQP